MLAWQILSIVGILFIILEVFTPSMFFLNFALAAFLTAIASLYISKVIFLTLIFFILSFLSFVFLRPLILKQTKKETETGLNDKYIGKIAKVIEAVSEFNGVITIYGERWEARSIDKTEIPAGAEVKIIKNESIVMYVEKLNN